jgi:hypothetical protein
MYAMFDLYVFIPPHMIIYYAPLSVLGWPENITGTPPALQQPHEMAEHLLAVALDDAVENLQDVVEVAG